MKALNLVGQFFTRLVVLRRGINTKTGKSQWWCKCVCGGNTLVAATQLVSGKTKSCGCLRRSVLGAASRKHGMTRTPVHRAWVNMRQRCYNKKTTYYCNYGGRGITVCKRWLVFENFYADMGDPPKGLMLEREDNDKGYGPENCVWATRLQQNRNRRKRKDSKYVNK